MDTLDFDARFDTKLPSFVKLDGKEITKLLESKKARECVRVWNKEWKKHSPLEAHVMLTERDAYMAEFLDIFNQFQCIVAVMGMAHMDGVESILREREWTHVKPKCPEP